MILVVRSRQCTLIIISYTTSKCKISQYHRVNEIRQHLCPCIRLELFLSEQREEKVFIRAWGRDGVDVYWRVYGLILGDNAIVMVALKIHSTFNTCTTSQGE